MELKRVYNERWTEQEETNLIHTRIRLDPEFQLPKTKNHWKVVREANLDKPTQIVTNKWQNLLKKYKKIVRNQAGDDEDVYFTDWSSFRDLHRFLKNKTQNKSALKGEFRTSAEESTTGTDASISIGDLDHMNLSFDYDKFESNLITKNESEEGDNTYEKKFETDRTNNHIIDPDLTIVKNEIDVDPIPIERNDSFSKWNTVLGNIEGSSTNKSPTKAQTQQFAIRHFNRTAPVAHEVTDFDDDANGESNYMPRPVNRMICGKRKIFRKPEYVSPKVFVKDPTLLTRFRPPRQSEEDEDRTFLLSLVPSLKKLNGEQKLIVKTEFLKVLTRISYPNSVLSQNI